MPKPKLHNHYHLCLIMYISICFLASSTFVFLRVNSLEQRSIPSVMDFPVPLQTVDDRFIEEEKRIRSIEKAIKTLVKDISSYLEEFQVSVCFEGRFCVQCLLDCAPKTLIFSMSVFSSGIKLSSFLVFLWA